jgi:hypothetical protein
MPTTTPDLGNPRDALAAAVETRARVRSLPPSDRARVEALRTALGLLRESWTSAHETYVRRGPQSAKRSYRADDPLRALARERRAEMKRLRSMLNPRTGTPRPAPIYSAAQMRSAAARAQRSLLGVRAEFEQEHAELRYGVYTGRGDFRTMRPLNDRATELLGDLGHVRDVLTRSHGRYQRGYDPAADLYGDDWDEIEDRVGVLRAEADNLGADLRRAMHKRKPDERPQDPTWTPGRILGALDRFYRANGRLPTQRACNASADLPSWPLIVRRIGNPPMAEVRRRLRIPDADASAS